MKLGIFAILLWILAIVGEIRCIYQFVTSDFDPVGKREWVYGVCTFTGFGAIAGYFNIPDEPASK